MSTDYISVKNVVCTFYLGVRELPLLRIAVALSARWDPRIFPAAVLRVRDTHSVVSIFASGRVVIVGAQTQDLGLLTAHELVARLWRLLRLDTNVLNFTTCNMVGAVALPLRPDLDLLLEHARQSDLTVQCGKGGRGGASYEPEAFPGLAWPVRHRDATMVFALFETGRGVVTGLKSAHDRDVANEVLATLVEWHALVGGDQPRKRQRRVASSMLE